MAQWVNAPYVWNTHNILIWYVLNWPYVYEYVRSISIGNICDSSQAGMICTALKLLYSLRFECLNNLDTYRQGSKSRPEVYIIDIIQFRREHQIPFMNSNYDHINGIFQPEILL